MILEAIPRKSSPVATANDFLSCGGRGGGSEEEVRFSLEEALGVENFKVDGTGGWKLGLGFG